jgi:O-antigen ligase
VTTSTIQERLVEAGALFLIVFTPFAFGTVEPWSEAIAELVILGMVVTWLIGNLRNWELRVELPAGWLPAALFLGLLALQATLPGWSLDPGATRRLGLKLGAVAAFFLVCTNTCRSRGQLRRAAWTMVATGVLISVFGVVQRVTWNGRFYWIGPEAPGNAVYTFGPFANRTHFAGLVVSVLPIALVLLLTRPASSTRRDALKGLAARFRGWNSQTSSARSLLPLLILIMAGAALASGSRGAIVTLVAVLLAIVGLGGGSRSGRARWIKVAVSALLIILAGAWIGGDVLYGTIERLLTELERPDEGFRLRVWPDALAMWWKEAPVVGSGLGSFAVAFPRFRTLRAPAVMSHAESDWLGVLVETGVIGFALVAATAVSLAVMLLRRRRLSKTYSARIRALAGLVALIGAAVQSLPNYNAPVMSNLIYLALVLTLASGGPTTAGGVIPGQAES